MLIDFNYMFTLYDITCMKSNGEYLTTRVLDVMDIINDLRKCLVVSVPDPITYVLKCYNSIYDIQIVRYKKRDETCKILKDIIVSEILIINSL